MKTIADFKRRITFGTLVKATLYWWNRQTNQWYVQKEMGVRAVSIVQSNSFAFATPISATETKDSWCDWPKKNEFEVLDEHTVQITEEGFARLIYEFV